MAVAIRLKKLGTKNRPMFRIIAVDSRKTRDGKSLAILGNYNPLTKPASITINEEMAIELLKTGAQPTPVVADILRQRGIHRTGAGDWVRKA
jgi:small subunit ribosomal protein S16